MTLYPFSFVTMVELEPAILKAQLRGTTRGTWGIRFEPMTWNQDQG